MITTSFGPGGAPGAGDADEALSTRLRDLALVDLDALVAGSDDSAPLLAAFADDVADALREARARIVALRTALGGVDALAILDVPVRQRAGDAGTQGAERTKARLTTQAEAARALARLSDLAGGLVPKLFEADRRR